MSVAYYGSRLSDNIIRTKENFLFCLNVPIARTGSYQYLKSELGLDGNPNEIVTVYREPNEVFDTRTVASFNGKAFTDTHPPVDVVSDNWSIYSKGEITNVRRGNGTESNLLLADILVRDPIVINEIESGSKREISAGYDCEWVTRNGKIYQENIRGNHVALVQAGRAGSTVRINDDAQKILVPKKYFFVKKLIKAADMLE